MSEDYYRTLNVDPKASADEIQKAYRALARRYHPDLNPQPAAASLMAIINQAYEVLSEPAKRAVYDRKKASPRNSAIDNAVMSAARETLLKKGWKNTDVGSGEFALKNGTRQAWVHTVPFLDPVILRQREKRSSGLCVILALRIDQGLKVSNEFTVVVDLMRSHRYSGTFPDDTYEALFRNFI